MMEKEIKYVELRPGDVIEWNKRTINDDSESVLEGPGIIKSFLTSGADPVGIIILTDGRHIHRNRVINKIVSDQRITVR